MVLVAGLGGRCRIRGSLPVTNLGGEHVGDAVYSPLQQQPTHKETQEHHVGEERAEVHHLRERQRQMEREGERERVLLYDHTIGCCHGYRSSAASPKP